MKKFAILSMTFLFAISFIQAQAQETKSERKALKNLEGNGVSEIAKTHFYTDFGSVQNAMWKRAGTYDEVTFTKGGKKMTSFYDYDANLVGTTEPKKFADLPANAQKEIKTKYKDYTIGAVIFYNDNEVNETDMIMYGTQFDDADNYFVEVSKANKTTILQVNMAGDVIFFMNL
jgi:hypothetical protein